MNPTLATHTVRALAAATLAGSAILTFATLRSTSAPRAAAQSVPLVGVWQTVASGDRLRALLREGETAWAASEGGGVVRWDLRSATFRQYLAPQDGLPSNDVRAVARDGAGWLWAATAKGLARLEPGAQVWHAVPVDHPSLASPSATALALAPDGGLWVGFEQRWDPAAVDPARGGEPGAFVGGGLARLDPATMAWGPVWRAEPVDGMPETFAPLPSANVTALAVDDDARLWIGTRPFYAWGDGMGAGVAGSTPAWVVVGGGLVVSTSIDANRSPSWRRWNSRSGTCASDVVHGIAVDDMNRVWVATGSRGLQVFLDGPDTIACQRGRGHVVYSRSPSMPGVPVRGNVPALAVDRARRVWASVATAVDEGAGMAVAVLDHGGTVGDDPAATADDAWTVTAPTTLPDPAAESGVVSALNVTDGEVLAGTRAKGAADGWGVLRLTGGDTWRFYTTAADGLPSNQLTAVAADPASGDVWFGTASRGVARWDGRSWRTWRWQSAGTVPPGPAGDGVAAIAFGPAGRVWVASRQRVWGGTAVGTWVDGGLASFDGRAWTVYRPEPGKLPPAELQALAVDAAGRVWIGTAWAGVVVYDPRVDTWTTHDRGSAGDAFGGQSVTDVAIEPASGDVWLSHRAAVAWTCDPPGSSSCTRTWEGGGVSRWDGTAWTHWAKSTGAPLEAFGDAGDLAAIAFDRGRSKVWAGGWVNRSDSFHWQDGVGIDASLNACPRGCSDAAWTGARFTDGGAVRALAVDAAGRLWAGLSRDGSGRVPPAAGVRVLRGDDEWSVWTPWNSDLPDDEVTALGSTGDGMWAGTLDRGAAVWRPFTARARVFLPGTVKND